MSVDRELLSARAVQQLGFADANLLLDAGTEWLLRRESGVSLVDVLTERGVLDTKTRGLVEARLEQMMAEPQPDLDTQPISTSDLNEFNVDLEDQVAVEARDRYSFDVSTGKTEVELGRGGVGQVLLARDSWLERLVAFKTINREITTSVQYETLRVRQLEARFLREARITAQLDHPAIVPVFEIARRRDGTLYFTMHRIRGRTLAQAIAATPTLEGRLKLVPHLVVAAQALASAHHRGVIHRDVKPQNVMIGGHGETWVMDWGLGRVMKGADEARAVTLAPDVTAANDSAPVGTPSYMAPEQAKGQHRLVDHRSDIWGLGAMLYELLTGRAPFIGPSAIEVLVDIREGRTPPPVRSLAPQAPPELVAICERALTVNREARYGSANVLAADLTAWLEGRRLPSRDYSVLDVARRLVTRYRAVTALAAALVLVGLGLAFASANAIRRERDEARTMARVFLADVAPTLANAPSTAEVVDRLSLHALDAFARGLDLDDGTFADRLLLARALNAVGASDARLGRLQGLETAVRSAKTVVAPLVKAHSLEPQVHGEALRLSVLEGELALARRDLQRARVVLTEAAAHSRRALSGAPTPEVEGAILRRQTLLATVLIELAEPEEALATWSTAIAESERQWASNQSEAALISLIKVLLEASSPGWSDDSETLASWGQRAVVAARTLVTRFSSAQSKALLAGALVSHAELAVERAEQLSTLQEAAALLGADDLRLETVGDEVGVTLVRSALASERGADAWRILNSARGSWSSSWLPVVALASSHDEALAAAEPRPAHALVYLAIGRAIAGQRAEALALARTCEAHQCVTRASWWPAIVRHRAARASGPGSTAVLQLVDEVPSSSATRSQRLAGWSNFVSRLAEVAP